MTRLPASFVALCLASLVAGCAPGSAATGSAGSNGSGSAGSTGAAGTGQAGTSGAAGVTGAAGDTIVSAGLTLTDAASDIVVRSAYPKGLLIGTVQAVELDPDALTRTAFVVPSVTFREIERMLVVRHFAQE